MRFWSTVSWVMWCAGLSLVWFDWITATGLIAGSMMIGDNEFYAED